MADERVYRVSNELKKNEKDIDNCFAQSLSIAIELINVKHIFPLNAITK